MKGSLSKKIFDGLLWMSLSKAGNVILHLLILAILARLLTPEDFGTIAAAMVVISLSDIFVQLGVGPSVIIKKNIDTNYIRTAFTLSVIFGTSMGLLVFFLAPLITVAFQIRDLTDLIKALSIVFPIKGLSVVAESLLKKNLKFKILAFRSLLSYALGYGAIGIILALMDFGVWALVFATLGQGIFNSVFVLLASPHNKRPSLQKGIVKQILFTGGGFTLSRVFSYLANQADNFIVARWLGTSALGFYNKAYAILKTPINLYGQMLHDVLFPALSNKKDNSAQLTSAFQNGTVFLSVFSLPLMVIMIVLAPEIILLFLGDQWFDAIQPFQIIAISMYFRVGYRISVTIAKSAGVIYKNAFLQIIYAIIIICAALIGKSWGINGVATGVSIAIFIQFLLMSNLGLKVASISWGKFLKLHLFPICLTLIMAPFILLTTYISRENNFPMLVILLLNLMITTGLYIIAFRYQLYRYFGEEISSFVKTVTDVFNKKLFSLNKSSSNSE